MPISENCVAVIPCLNEAGTITALVKEVLRYLPAVIVVDDGSMDETGANATEAGAIVFSRARSGGKGSALGLGFRRARELGYSWAICLDGDGQHAASDIPHLLSAAENSSALMVVGNRMNNPGAMPLVRQWVNRWMSQILSSFCGCEFPDSQCGFRLVNLRSWARFTFRAKHFEIESELLVRFALAGLPTRFVPVETRYGSERSKIHPFRDTIRWFTWWRRIRSELFRDSIDILAATDGTAPAGALTVE